MNKSLYTIIKRYPEGVREYALMQAIEQEYPGFYQELGESPSLYQRHFYLFYHLYQLDNRLRSQSQKVQVDTLDIRILEHKPESGSLSSGDPLRDFYLHKDNLYLSENEVSAMQKKFWQKYLALEQKASAIKLLGLQGETKLTKKSVKKKFNQLAQKHHPDKGGDAEYFQSLRGAYEELKLVLD